MPNHHHDDRPLDGSVNHQLALVDAAHDALRHIRCAGHLNTFLLEFSGHRGISRPRFNQYDFYLSSSKTVLQTLGITRL